MDYRRPAIICDLDNCLCDATHRMDLFFQGKMSEFESRLFLDTINQPVAAVIASLSKSYEILFVTARGKHLWEPTVSWLKSHIPQGISWRLFMRETANHDGKAKEIIYNENIKGKYEIFFVMDDRNECVKMWRSLGLKCFQVAEGNY